MSKTPPRVAPSAPLQGRRDESLCGPRVVAITGGPGGIGRAILEHFRQEGCRVGVCSRSPRPKSLPKDVLHVRADVTRRADLDRFVGQVVRRLGGLDVFVNCAGVSRWRSLEDIGAAFATEILGVNLLGTLWGCAAAVSALRRGGSIVNVSSLAGKRGSANNTLYCASKFAVNGITQSLAKELGPRGIRVNAVCPVYVETEAILQALAERPSPARDRTVAEFLKSFAESQTALDRLPSAEEVAQVVFFLASADASAVTGQCINVDCGTFPQ